MSGTVTRLFTGSVRKANETIQMMEQTSAENSMESSHVRRALEDIRAKGGEVSLESVVGNPDLVRRLKEKGDKETHNLKQRSSHREKQRPPSQKYQQMHGCHRRRTQQTWRFKTKKTI